MKGKILQDRYRITKILGQDTFTDTFLAKDDNWYSPQRYVIKKFRPILGNPQAKEIRELLHREASVLKLLSGENSQIPHLYEYFMDGEDFYLVREWIKGITLEQKVKRQGKLSQTEVKEILNSILSVLKFIHNYGIVYRQLKPSSIVLRQEDWIDRFHATNSEIGLPVPISEFGGVKDLEKKVTRLNRRSLVLANHHEYTSPEQEQGESVYASNVYSLGLIAIYLLTGKTPAELPQDSYSKRLLWQQEVPNISNNLARVINRSICPSIGDRFTSPEEMLRSLNPQSVNISESIVTLSKKQSALTPEIKITAVLSALGFGVMGVSYGLLNFDLAELLTNNDHKESTPAETNKAANSSTKTPKNLPQSSLNIPAFRVDSPQKQIENLLGKPTQKSSGYWGDSQALIYQNFVPKQVDLGYLVDNKTNTIRQTEMSFADSVDASEAHHAIRLMLLDGYSTEIEQKINRVFARKSNEQRFEVGKLKGIIQRNEENRIYIAIWNRDFHE